MNYKSKVNLSQINCSTVFYQTFVFVKKHKIKLNKLIYKEEEFFEYKPMALYTDGIHKLPGGC